ncbi:MAG: hypothetical protein WAU39_12275 [Polyangiales bacterium]
MKISSLPSWLRKFWRPHLVLTILLLAAGGHFLWWVNRLYPIRDWLFWHYLSYWVLVAGWTLGLVSTGWALLNKLRLDHWSVGERLVVAHAVGFYGFFLLMFVLGLLGLYGGVLFFALPLAMIAVGVRPLWRELAPRVATWQRTTRPPSLLRWVAIAFGALCLGLIYFAILTPANVSFDSDWKHLGIAQQYAASGGIVRFKEGWLPGTAPQLASVIYTWAFLLPLGNLFDIVELAAHQEFALFLVTLVAINVLVGRLVPSSTPRVAWVVRFLFPGVMLYDSSLSLGADHIAAIWSAPIFLLLMRYWDEASPKVAALLACVMAGAMLTKYSAVLPLTLFPIVAVALRAGLGIWRAKAGDGSILRQALLGPAVALGVGLMLTAPHYLKNWIFYADPLYPMLHAYLPSTPWGPESAYFWADSMAGRWKPAPGWAGVLETLGALFSFSYVPHDYPSFHRNLPVFGSLFTILMFALPWCSRKSRWLWAAVGYVLSGIVLWYVNHHQDRHLQMLLPTMAACTGAIMIHVWGYGRAARAALAGLVLLQVIWGSDVYFFQTHAMARSPAKKSIDLISAGFEGKREERFVAGQERLADISDRLPEDAVVLLHQGRLRLGLRRPIVVDRNRWQNRIRYDELREPGAIYDELSGLGVTHVIWSDVSRAESTLASDLAFYGFVTEFGVPQRGSGSEKLSAMPPHRPAVQYGDAQVAYSGCNKRYPSGVYHLSDLRVPSSGPRSHVFPKPERPAPPGRLSDPSWFEGVTYVVTERGCEPPPNLLEDFRPIGRRQGRGLNQRLYIRRRSR